MSHKENAIDYLTKKALTDKADKPTIKDFESHLILLRITISP